MSKASLLARLDTETRRKFIASLSEQERAYLPHNWAFWARPAQLAPKGAWETWLILAGRGFGKTRSGAEWVREKVKEGCSRIAIVAATAADARDVMVEGESGIAAVCWEHDVTHEGEGMGRPKYEPSKRRLTWANGAQAILYSAEEPDRLRGPQHDAAWADEICAWQYGRDTWDMLQFGLRLGELPQCCLTTTPKPMALLRDVMLDAGTVVTGGSTYDNAANLAPGFMRAIAKKYEGTRLGRQELHAEILDDMQGALWQREWFDKGRRAPGSIVELVRVVVAVDPTGSRGGDATGIVVAGKGVDGRAYVLADYSCNLSPSGWGRRAIDAYRRYDADRVVAETNFGGEMVEATIRTVDVSVPYKAVHASRGKVVRAEPIAALYEQGRVSHVGKLDELEDQCCLMAANGFEGEGSPDRVDALVWALTELMVESVDDDENWTMKQAAPGIFNWVRKGVRAQDETPTVRHDGPLVPRHYTDISTLVDDMIRSTTR